MPLLTKTQLKDNEPGEFSESKPRTYPETQDLIEHFPWSQQREHFTVGLTCPSITIEGSSGDYLKLALYYNNKFVLYYLDTKNHVWTYPIITISEAYPIIQSFFDNSFDPASFHRQLTPFTNNRVLFETKDFHYTMHGSSIAFLISIAAIVCMIYPSVTIIAALTKASSIPMAGFIALGILSLLFLTIGIFLIRLCINHYRASKNKILSISRGNPLFYYGDVNAPTVYDKNNIRQVVQYGGTRSSNDRLSRTEIIFKDGSTINVSGLILSSDIMSAKFPHQDHKYGSVLRRFFIPRVSATPS